MLAAAKRAVPDDDIAPPRSQWAGGKRRAKPAPPRSVRTIGWPEDKHQRIELRSLWFFMTAQAVPGVGSTLLALREWTFAATGTCTKTDAELSRWGGISASKISKDIALIAHHGWLIRESVTVPDPRGGRPFTHRTLKLAVPDPFPNFGDVKVFDEITVSAVDEMAHVCWRKQRPKRASGRHTCADKGRHTCADSYPVIPKEEPGPEMNQRGADGFPTASDAGDSPDNDRHDATARLKRASVMSPSPSVEI